MICWCTKTFSIPCINFIVYNYIITIFTINHQTECVIKNLLKCRSLSSFTKIIMQRWNSCRIVFGYCHRVSMILPQGSLNYPDYSWIVLLFYCLYVWNDCIVFYTLYMLIHMVMFTIYLTVIIIWIFKNYFYKYCILIN